MTTANESKLGGARGGHRGPIVLRVAAARVLPLLPVAARGARLVLSMGLAAGCVRARSSSSPLRGGHCPPLAASTSRLEVWLRCSVHVGCGTPLFRRVVGCRRPARVREGHAEARRHVAGSALHRAWRGRRGEAEAAGGCTRCCLIRCGGGSAARGARIAGVPTGPHRRPATARPLRASNVAALAAPRCVCVCVWLLSVSVCHLQPPLPPCWRGCRNSLRRSDDWPPQHTALRHPRPRVLPDLRAQSARAS